MWKWYANRGNKTGFVESEDHVNRLMVAKN